MANNIALRKQYATMLDEVYALAALTSILDGPSELVREGANAEEILIPKLSMDGLGNYSKTTGYPSGDVTLQYETKKCGYDRGKMFTVDAMDNIDTAGIAFGRLSGEFIRTKEAPELDAYRFGAYAQKAGTTVGADITTGKAGIAAIRTMKSKMKDAEVDISSVYLFISVTLKGLIDDLETYESKKVFDGFAGVIEVPAGRFYSKVTLGTNGYSKDASTGKALNFLGVDKKAVIQYQKHRVPKIISPEQNQDADAYKFGLRTVGIAEVEDNKSAGVYAHTVA